MLNKKDLQLLEDTRKNFHRYPELSGQEMKTAEKIKLFLNEYSKNAQILTVAKTGIIANFKGQNTTKKILIRADIDALQIKETNSFSHKSTIENVSHKCGHDGHTTILLGLAKLLNDKPIPNLNISLLWQPSEENGQGAKMVLNDPVFKNLDFDYVYALHNLPKFPRNQIVIKEGVFSSHVKSMIISLKGKTAHAAEPEHGYNPSKTLTNILTFAQNINKNEPKSDDFFLITPIYAKLGSKDYGISAGQGELHFTMRSWTPDIFELNINKLLQFLEKQCKKEHLKYKIKWLQEFDANINDKEAMILLEKSLQEYNLQYQKIRVPFKWGEDFGVFTQKFKGAMFGLGTGDIPALHNPDYDFPDESINTGVQAFYNLLKTIS